MELILMSAAIFLALGGAYWLYGLAVLLAGIAAWRHHRGSSAKGLLVGAGVCLVLAASAHWATIVIVPGLFRGAITG